MAKIKTVFGTKCLTKHLGRKNKKTKKTRGYLNWPNLYMLDFFKEFTYKSVFF